VSSASFKPEAFPQKRKIKGRHARFLGAAGFVLFDLLK
jgi:hypothetical protein